MNAGAAREGHSSFSSTFRRMLNMAADHWRWAGPQQQRGLFGHSRLRSSSCLDLCDVEMESDGGNKLCLSYSACFRGGSAFGTFPFKLHIC